MTDPTIIMDTDPCVGGFDPEGFDPEGFDPEGFDPRDLKGLDEVGGEMAQLTVRSLPKISEIKIEAKTESSKIIATSGTNYCVMHNIYNQ